MANSFSAESPLGPIFGVTHPLGLPRPIDSDNFFGARIFYFARNLMPVPAGCLAHFDRAVYRPYASILVAALGQLELGWSGPVETADPPRYCLLHDGIPADIPVDLRSALPPPPKVPVAAILHYFARHHESVAPMQLLDILTLVSEDLGAAKFATVTAPHPWVADFMR